ncbi:MAG: YtxH domain-containing protein [Dehalococcoidia bacterium]|jgi:gas vesicle protein
MSNEAGEKFFMGLIVGTVLGIAIGIFNAPRSGEETKEMLKEKLDALGNRIKQAREKSE